MSKGLFAQDRRKEKGRQAARQQDQWLIMVTKGERGSRIALRDIGPSYIAILQGLPKPYDNLCLGDASFLLNLMIYHPPLLLRDLDAHNNTYKCDLLPNGLGLLGPI